jgi:hypothetical protein
MLPQRFVDVKPEGRHILQYQLQATTTWRIRSLSADPLPFKTLAGAQMAERTRWDLMDLYDHL